MRNSVDVENCIIEMRKVGTTLKAFNNEEEGTFTADDEHIALQVVKELFDSKMENLEAAFYKNAD